MSNTENTEKKLIIWYRYIDVLHRYGEHARKMTKESIYEETGLPWRLKPNTIQRIISKMLKDKNRRDELKHDEELAYLLQELESIAAKGIKSTV